ncbi:TonB-dependent receptor plug domain-containing protein [Stigmatella erecta]|uniref:TonB-dependent Receptor Plug Domain n=1 Tax=Stigmatella erecta TaxID=83460 RepID=A0A1I0JJ60_9BACT|nr:TonB-dependent receptor [Stigmatella erecta]SEU10194.1 TonB-dependent Receptor Plug Domain [Stigmatella erecta]
MPSNPRNAALALAVLVNGSAGIASAQDAAPPAPPAAQAPATTPAPASVPQEPPPAPSPTQAAPGPAPTALPPSDAPVAPATPAAPAAPAATPAPRPARPAAPQPAAQEPPPEEYVEEIVVTGSRIPRKELTTAAPVTVLDKAQIEATGRTTIAEILQNLPEQSNAINTQYNNGGDGSSRVNLRGIGASRTLVLLNGRRHVAGGTGANSSVDLNAIPTVAIQRIEVLKDGGSAVYGSDAIGGVVNIITRQDYSGTELRAFTGVSGKGDGLLYDLSLTTGQSTERGNILFSAGYYTQKDVFAGDRDYSLYDRAYNFNSRRITTSGSTTTPQGAIIEDSRDTGAGNEAWERLISSGSGAYYRGADGWRDFDTSGVSDAGGDLFNYQPDNYLVTPSERAHVYANGGLRLGAQTRAFFEATYVNRQSSQQLASEPLNTVGEGVVVSADNVYNPFNRDFNDVRRRLNEFGTRGYEQDINTFRVVTGLQGKLPEGLGFLTGWGWEASFNHGRTTGVELKEGNLRLSRLQSAVGPSFIDPATGAAVCGTPDAPIDGCVPLNLFGGEGTITPEMRDYLSYRGTRRGNTQQTVLSANVGGELFRLFPSARALGLAVGYEHRREAGSNIPDPLTNSGDTTGNKVAATEGSYYINEGYAELSIPVLGGTNPETGDAFDIWEVSGAARAFNYNTFGSGATYKIGTRVSPIPDFTLRSTYSTAFRAPAVNELYLGSTDSFDDVVDPCSERAPGTEIDRRCTAAGVPADFEDARSQQRAVVGGNRDLEPETAKILTVGAVFQPRWVKDLSATVDYYLVDVEDAIQSVGTSVILNNCYTNGTYCDRIVRLPGGLIDTISNPLSNVGGNTTSGIDISLRYQPQTPYGRFGFGIDATYLAKFEQELSDGTIISGKDNYDLELVLPNWKANLGVNWAMDPISAGVNVRWLNGYKECQANACDVEEGAPTPLSRNVSSYYTVDLNAAYTWMTGVGNTTAQLGVNNVLNRAPPRLYAGFLADSDASTYDYMGRYFYARLSHEFY